VSLAALDVARRATAEDRARWDAFVAARPEGDVLQTWAWGEVIGPTGQRPERLVVTRTDGEIAAVGLALVRGTLLGRTVAYLPHGPVWDRDAPDAAEALAAIVAGVDRFARSIRAVVVKLDPRARPGTGGSEKGSATDAPVVRAALSRLGLRPARYDLQARHTRIVDVAPDEEARLAGWSSNARNLFRRAAKEGTEVEIHRSIDGPQLDEFYDLVSDVGRRARFHVRDRAFFERLARELGPSGVRVAIARHEGVPIATMYVAVVGDRAYYLYGGVNRDAPREANGGYRAMGDMLTALAEDGVRTLDLWGVSEGSDPNAEEGWAGFSLFKSRFGGTPLDHPGTFDRVIDRPLWLVRETREALSSAVRSTARGLRRRSQPPSEAAT
jgi:lipid II:glycine glycyltransferase (peptidoglycan interpeptide bridge formation enzyme)